MQERRVDVVIAGAGPTGLMLACELALGGASALVVERLAAPDETIKAGAVWAPGAEALLRRGLGPLLDEEERAGVAAMAAMVQSTGATALPMGGNVRKIGGHFAGIFRIDQTRQREPERRLRGVKQQALERILAQQAQALGVEVRRGVALHDFVDDGEGVRVEAQGPEGPLRARCAYLVGCDGGRSAVRKRAGFAFVGTEPTITGHQAIVELDHPEKLLPLGWRRTERGMLAYGPFPGRVFVVEFDGPPPDRDAPITADEVQQSLRRVSGTDVTITALKSATRFTDNARQATTYRAGRVLLAGDAAHVHSPFGGQGLNLGLLDAANLGWKLAATVRGRAPEGLLDTYTSERHPVAARALDATRAQVALMRPDPLTTALRQIVTELMDLDEGNRYFGDLMGGMTIRYDLGDDHPLVGRLCADRPLSADGGEASLYGAMRGGGAVLVDAGRGELGRLAAGWAPAVRVVRADDGPSTLVRPDGCVAWASDDHRDQGLEPALRRWFGAPAAA